MKKATITPFVYAFIYIVLALVMLFIRQNIGAMTPDEIGYIGDIYRNRLQEINYSIFARFGTGLPFQYYVASVLFQFLYKHDELTIYFFNILIVSSALFVSYKAFWANSIRKCKYWWLLMFLMPNVLFFSVSVLRDIHIFALVVFLLSFYKDNPLSVKVFLVLLGIWLLRPELGFTVSVSLFIVSLKIKVLRKWAVLGYILISIGFMVYLSKESWYLYRIDRALSKYGSFGILGFTSQDVFLPFLLLSNMVLFFFPFTSEFYVTSLFGNILIFYGLANLYIFYKIKKCGFSFCKNDKISNFVALNIILFLPIAANESNASAAVRHGICILPFIYMYFNRCILPAKKILMQKKRHQGSSLHAYHSK